MEIYGNAFTYIGIKMYFYIINKKRAKVDITPFDKNKIKLRYVPLIIW